MSDWGLGFQRRDEDDKYLPPRHFPATKAYHLVKLSVKQVLKKILILYLYHFPSGRLNEERAYRAARLMRKGGMAEKRDKERVKVENSLQLRQLRLILNTYFAQCLSVACRFDNICTLLLCSFIILRYLCTKHNNKSVISIKQ